MSTTKNEHNPANVTPKAVGEGWRLLTTGEVQEIGDEWWYGGEWCPVHRDNVGRHYKFTTTRRRITPPTDTTGSGKEGETPEVAEAMERGRRAGVAASVIAEYSQHILSLEGQRDAALAELAGYKAVPKDHVIDRSAPVKTQLAQAEAWIAQLQQSYRSIQQTCANKDAQVEALRRPIAAILARWDRVTPEMKAKYGGIDADMQALRAAIDSAQRQEKP